MQIANLQSQECRNRQPHQRRKQRCPAALRPANPGRDRQQRQGHNGPFDAEPDGPPGGEILGERQRQARQQEHGGRVEEDVNHEAVEESRFSLRPLVIRSLIDIRHALALQSCRLEVRREAGVMDEEVVERADRARLGSIHHERAEARRGGRLRMPTANHRWPPWACGEARRRARRQSSRKPGRARGACGDRHPAPAALASRIRAELRAVARHRFPSKSATLRFARCLAGRVWPSVPPGAGQWGGARLSRRFQRRARSRFVDSVWN